MKKYLSLITIIVPVILALLAPALLMLAEFTNDQNLFLSMMGIFNTYYFNLLPGLFLFTAVYFFRGKIKSTVKKGPLLIQDYIGLGLTAAGLLFFFWVYSVPPDSILFQVDSIIPPIGTLAPDLQTFLLWNVMFLTVMGGLLSYWAAERLGLDKTMMGGMLLAVSISLLMAVSVQKIPVVQTMEDLLVNVRFSLMRNPGSQIHQGSGLKYCMPPADISGQSVSAFAPNPPGVRDDIEIIGVSNKTIEEVHGNWPLDWGIYARLINALSNAEGNIMLFDISFLDEKGVFGGNYCGIYFNCSPLSENVELRGQSTILAEAMQNAKNVIISDYPMETTDESLASIVNYKERMEVLKETSALKNVKNGAHGYVWARMPLPPAMSVAKVLDGMGYANVLKDEHGYNRWIPMVVRIQNRARASQPDYNPDIDDEYYPSIDLELAVKYYGVDLQKDVEVDWLAGYIKISNIPQKTITRLNKETFEMETLDIMAQPNADRSVIIPINQKGLMDINFRGGRYCFKYNELLASSKMEPTQAAQYYKDKIVLIAMYYATGVGTAKDTHLAPYGDMAGIEHHAYALNTILNQDFITNAGPLTNLIILLSFALLIGLYQSKVSTLMNFILVTIVTAIAAVATMIIFDQFSILHVFPSLILQQFLIFVAFIGFRILTEEENVKFIRNTFSKFVSQDVVEELLANPDAISLGGSKKEVSVFFSDVRGFTTISEALGPEQLVQLLNEYLSEMTEIIIDYRGTIDKYMGDAIMAFWGAPAHNDDHAYFACVSALANVEALMKLRKQWSEKGDIPVLDIGIGINTGQAVVGNMGSSRRMDYTLMGDTVNLGSRLEGITKQYGVRICISEFTYERVKDRVYARELDLVRVKGKLEPVRIYELMGLKDSSDMDKLKVKQVHTH